MAAGRDERYCMDKVRDRRPPEPPERRGGPPAAVAAAVAARHWTLIAPPSPFAPTRRIHPPPRSSTPSAPAWRLR